MPLLLVLAVAAAGEDSLVVRGYERFYNLDYTQAESDFSAYAASHPDDPSAYNHIAHSILYRDLFRAGALETEMVTGNNPFLRRAKVSAPPSDRLAFDQNVDRAIALAQARLKRNPQDAAAYYSLGVSYGLRANSDFLIRKAWTDALHDASAARRAHARVTEIDPGFIDARMVQGLYDYVVGSLPLHWRALGWLTGYRGSREQGIRTIEYVASHGQVNRVDAEFLLCAIYRRERKPQLAVPLVRNLLQRFPENYLLRMELAQMYSDMQQPERALAVLERLRSLKLASAPGFTTLPLERICFAEGNVQFWYNDLDAALVNMQRAAAAANNLDLNTGVLAWMRLGQIYDLRGERRRASEAYSRAIGFAPDSDAAKESRLYLDAPYRRGGRRGST
ncbi:MAG TPA: tetratricopeptide repeat protein [Bryobacteraceae bacterium]|nr:tetratricopeptide repeat protein [Bryobacteraceae bacterium]